MVDWNLIRCGANRLCIPDLGQLVWVREADGNIDIGRREAGCRYANTTIDDWGWAIFRVESHDRWPGVTHWARIVKPEPPEGG